MHPATEVIAMDFGDPMDYLSAPIKITLRYQIPDYAFTGENELIFVPLLASDFMRRAMPHLYINTNIEERNFDFRDRCSRLVKLQEIITIPDGYTASLPDTGTTSLGSVAHYTGGYETDENTITLNQEIILEKRVYDKQDWPEVRAAILAQKKMGNTPVVLKK